MKKLFLILGISAFIFACGSGAEDKAADTQTPAETPAAETPDAAASSTRGLELIGSSDCTTCHAIDKKGIGPAYVDVAKKYENSPAVVDTLISKIIHGGSGNWGAVPKTPHPDLPDQDAREMVNYILSLKNR